MWFPLRKRPGILLRHLSHYCQWQLFSFAPEDTAKHFDGKEEGMAAGNPSLVV